MIGRESELESISAALEGAVSGAVIVTGEPGIGKTTAGATFSV